MRLTKLAALVLTFILLVPAVVHPQIMAPQPPGKMNIYSSPNSGALVTINGNPQSQHTNASFVVTPGLYSVVVSFPSAKQPLSCTIDGNPAKGSSPVKVPVASEVTVTVRCQ
jgi:hypothetical protein